MKARLTSVEEVQASSQMTGLESAAVADHKALARALSDASGGLVVGHVSELVAGDVVVTCRI
jgi:hypothetical protein